MQPMAWGLWSRTLGSAAAVLVLAGGLGGCLETLPEPQVGTGEIRAAVARSQLTSPRAATVALVSLEGAPQEIEGRFRQALASAAAPREITITDVASAHYLLRGYLSAYPGEGGVTVAYAYDVFDSAAKQRLGRVADTLDVPGDAGDPWGAVNETVMASLVGRGADELAGTLGGTPEAQASANAVAAAPALAPSPVN